MLSKAVSRHVGLLAFPGLPQTRNRSGSAAWTRSYAGDDNQSPPSVFRLVASDCEVFHTSSGIVIIPRPSPPTSGRRLGVAPLGPTRFRPKVAARHPSRSCATEAACGTLLAVLHRGARRAERSRGQQRFLG